MKSVLILFGMVLFAQLEPPTPEGLHGWLGAAVAIMGTVYLAIMTYKALKKPDRDPPIEADLGKLKEDFGAKLEAMQTHLDGQRKVDVGKLYDELRKVERTTGDKLTEATERIAGVEANSTMHTAQLATHGHKLDQILMRLPRKD